MHGTNCVEVEEKLTRNLEKVSAWLDASVYMVFNKKKRPVTEYLNIRIKDKVIKQVSEEKYCGMILDSQ